MTHETSRGQVKRIIGSQPVRLAQSDRVTKQRRVNLQDDVAVPFRVQFANGAVLRRSAHVSLASPAGEGSASLQVGDYGGSHERRGSQRLPKHL
jgi:uncharacterized protein (DUF58 family)